MLGEVIAVGLHVIPTGSSCLVLDGETRQQPAGLFAWGLKADFPGRQVSFAASPHQVSAGFHQDICETEGAQDIYTQVYDIPFGDPIQCDGHTWIGESYLAALDLKVTVIHQG